MMFSQKDVMFVKNPKSVHLGCDIRQNIFTRPVQKHITTQTVGKKTT